MGHAGALGAIGGTDSASISGQSQGARGRERRRSGFGGGRHRRSSSAGRREPSGGGGNGRASRQRRPSRAMPATTKSGKDAFAGQLSLVEKFGFRVRQDLLSKVLKGADAGGQQQQGGADRGGDGRANGAGHKSGFSLEPGAAVRRARRASIDMSSPSRGGGGPLGLKSGAGSFARTQRRNSVGSVGSAGGGAGQSVRQRRNSVGSVGSTGRGHLHPFSPSAATAPRANSDDMDGEHADGRSRHHHH